MLRAGFRLAAARRELSEAQFEFDRLYNVVSGKKSFGKVTFDVWLKTLHANPRVLKLEARPEELKKFKAAFKAWKKAGYPDPGNWPDAPFKISEITRKWVDAWASAMAELKSKKET